MIKMTAEQKALLDLLGHNLFSAEPKISPDVDYEQVIKESMAQAVFSVAFNDYRSLPLSDELSARVKKALMKHALSNAECFKNHNYLHDLLTKRGIKYCVLKGAASALYYPDMMLRSMGDVDFYVAPDQFDAAYELMKSEGFEPGDTTHESHIALSKGKKHFEIHFKPVGYHGGRLGDIYLDAWKGIIDDSVLNNTEVTSFVGPSAFHHGFILLTHLHSHLVSAGVGLRHLIDWGVFADSFSDAEFRAIFEAKLRSYGIWRLAQLLSLAAVRHMGMEHRPWMGDDYETADALLEDILCGGNFGRKDKQRGYEGLLIADNSRNVSSNKLKNAFTSLNRIVEKHWGCVKKLPILYPVGWIVFSLRFLFRVLTGKRKMNIVTAYKNSGSRAELYDSLRLFVPEE